MAKLDRDLEYLRCAEDPIYFIEKYLTVFDQTVNKIVPFKLFEFQKIAISHFSENRFVITNKYRQAGMTTTTCAYLAHSLMFKENQYIAVVANQLDTAVKILKTVNEFIKTCPDWLRPVEVKKDQKHKTWDNKNEAKAFASTEIRGFTPTLLFWDETAHSPDGISFWTSTYPTLSTGGRAIFVSTPLGMDPVFAKTFMDSKNGLVKRWVAYEIYWWQDPRYSEDLSWVKEDCEPIIELDRSKHQALIDQKYKPTSPWYEETKLEYFSKGRYREFSQEIESSFVGSSATLVPDDILEDRINEDVVEPNVKEGFNGNVWIWRGVDINKTYTMGSDVALGTSDDSSTFSIICNETKEQVVEYQGKIQPGEFGEMLYKYGMMYNEAYAIIDVTGGAGSETVSKLLGLGYTNLHYVESKKQGLREVLNKWLKHVDEKTFIPGFVITNGNRVPILQEMVRQITEHEVIIHSKRFYQEQKTFLYLGGTRFADHLRSTHDDLIFATSIALYVMQYVKDLATIENDKLKAMLDSYSVIRNGVDGPASNYGKPFEGSFETGIIKPNEEIKTEVKKPKEPSLYDFLLNDEDKQTERKPTKPYDPNDFSWVLR